MTCLLDTHFLVWIVSNSGKLKVYPWLKEYAPWTVSPVSFLEIQLLAEVGRGRLNGLRFTEDVMQDARFIVDEVSVVALIQKSLNLSWTRDPFDRLIAAHSLARRVPLCSVDQNILEHHRHIVRELR
jgi:PIN domain nuclease of toxin-antitoxin system